jgi:hypothetical protein
MNEETGTIIRDLMGFNDEIQTLKKKAEDAVKTISKLLEKTKGLYLVLIQFSPCGSLYLRFTKRLCVVLLILTLQSVLRSSRRGSNS